LPITATAPNRHVDSPYKKEKEREYENMKIKPV
jgi:hypothetical protein